MVRLQSYNGCVVETVTKWLCFYVCETEGEIKIMDEYLREPEKERDGPVPLLALSVFA